MIHLQNNEINLDISLIGAEIHHLRDRNGVERIWQNEPDFWPSHTPLLFPIAGALKDNTWYYQGKAYTMPKHGYVRQLPFELESADETHAVLVLRGEAIRHEGYACEGGIEQYEVVFPEDDALEQTLLDGSLIRYETRTLPLHDHVLTVQPEDFAHDALVFLNARSREVTLRRKDRAYEVSVSFPQCDVLLLWTKPGAPYLCIEPWCNAPDRVDSDQQLEHKPGMIRVEPGEEHAVTHTLTFR